MPEDVASQHETTQDDDSERDTLPMAARVTLRQHLDAALAAPASAESEALGRELETADGELEARDTEPSLDAKLLRDAFRAVGR